MALRQAGHVPLTGDLGLRGQLVGLRQLLWACLRNRRGRDAAATPQHDPAVTVALAPCAAQTRHHQARDLIRHRGNIFECFCVAAHGHCLNGMVAQRQTP